MIDLAPDSVRAPAKIPVLFVNSPCRLGADTFIHTLLMRHLDRSRFEVHVASTAVEEGEPAPVFDALAAIPDVHLQPAFFGPSLVGKSFAAKAALSVQAIPTLASLARLAAYVRRNRIRILHSSDRPRDALSCVLLAGMTGSKSVIHVHVGYGTWMSRASRWSMRLADMLVGVSRYVARTLVDGGHSPQKTRAVLNAIEPSAWDPALDGAPTRARLGIPAGAPAVVSVGRLFKWKGQAEVIRAMAIVRRELPDARLLIVGEDDQTIEPGGASFKAYLRGLAAELGLAENVIFTGHTREVAAMLAAADVFALPSLGEPFGLAYAEAMAMKRPVIALDSGGASEVVDHGKSGLLSRAGDLDALAGNLLTLLKDAPLRKRMGEYGRKQVEARFTPDRMTADVEQIYGELISCRRSSARSA